MYSALKQFGTVKLNEPLAKHTTFKIGGPADLFLRIEAADKLIAALRILDGEGMPYFILGGGSNMLVRDEGFRGVVMRVGCQKSEIRNQTLVADAGCATVEIAQKSMAAGLTGFEWGVGVPGTIGGAVRGNAGAMGGEMKDVVTNVEVYRDGEALTVSRDECRFAYRESIFKHNHDIILRVTIDLQKATGTDGMKQALSYLQYRNATQPQGHSSTGCIFKNYEFSRMSKVQSTEAFPKEFIAKGRIPAGWLVEQAGMKGVRIGQAEVSPRHGNFIVNLGGATAQDVLKLIAEIKERVYDKFKIELAEEIEII